MTCRLHGPKARCADCPASLAGRPVQTERCPACAARAQREYRKRWKAAKRAGTPLPPQRKVRPVTAQLIRETRARCGWSYGEIARDFGVGIRTAWRHARDGRNVRTERAQRRAAA